MPGMDYEMPKDVVPPGNQTGIYYIPISNLPFNASWQQLKDYVRQVCEVDHVEVFQKSTAGWVRLKGFENFTAAFNHLNGKDFNGRAIIADKRNVDSPLKVRDLGVSRSKRSICANTKTSSSVSEFPEDLDYAGGPVSHQSAVSSPVSTTSSSFSQGTDRYSMSLTHTSLMTSPETSFSHSGIPSYDPIPPVFSLSNPLSHYGFGSGSAQTAQSFPSYMSPNGSNATTYLPPASYAVQYPYNDYDYYPPQMAPIITQLASLAIDGSLSSGVVYTEQRSIHIREISRRASEEQLRKMIREAIPGATASSLSQFIIKLEVPLDRDRKPRGWATAHFCSAALARYMAETLDGTEFKGKKLQVRLAKEGETVSGGPGTAPSPAAATAAAAAGASSNSKRPHRSGGGGGGGRHSSKKDEGRRTERRDKNGGKGAPLVVVSHTAKSTTTTTTTASSASSSSARVKEKPEGRGGSKKSSVVIADGSYSGRRHIGSDRR